MKYFIRDGHYINDGPMIYRTDGTKWYWYSPNNRNWLRISGIPYKDEIEPITEEDVFLEFI